MGKVLKRISTSPTYEVEKVILDKLAGRLYKYFRADFFTAVAALGAIIISLSFFWAARSLNYLFFASFGIFINWFGDSLDGRTARLRDEARPLYGHYMDHLLDIILVTIIVISLNSSSLTTTNIWLYTLILILLTFNHVNLKSSVTKVFKLSVGKLGGTDLRIIFLLLSFTIIISGNPIIAFGRRMTYVDLLGYVACLITIIFFTHGTAKSLWGKNRIPNK